MNKELIIDSRPNEVVIALLEDKKLVELHRDKANNNYTVGDVYLGRVRKLVPGLNAAFVDVGYEKDAFLHYLDLGPQINSLNSFLKKSISGNKISISSNNFRLEKDIEKTGKIAELLAPNQNILVQIAKEPISNKGPRISSELAFAGRFLVLVPFSDRISISQKIKNSEERNRLKKLVHSIKPKNFGIIIRTVAEHKSVSELINDLEDLVSKWESLSVKITSANAPQKVFSEMDRSSAILRDLLNESFNSIIINDSALLDDLKSYVRTIAPEKVDIVKVYKGKSPIFEYFGIDKQIKSLFGKKVATKNGAYLIVEHTEAMHVIDVNSGHRNKKVSSQETNASDVNMDAAAEIARQLRLRDMGGIIVIDFIDMHEASHRRGLFEKLRTEMTADKAKHTILPPSKFGLVQITRQRVRPETDVQILEKCPACDGTGEIKSSLMLVDEIENNILYLLKQQNEKYIKLIVHPYVYAFLCKGLLSIKNKWRLKFRKKINIDSSNSYHFLEYHFFNKNQDEIRL